jgi:serine/threonine-protein kinase
MSSLTVLKQPGTTTQKRARSGTAGLPPSLLLQAQRRLSIFALVLAVNSAIAFLIGGPLWARLGIDDTAVIRAVQVSFVVGSTAMFALARYGPHRLWILDVGLAYEVVLCFLGALGHNSMVLGAGDSAVVATVSHVLIVAYPLIVPSSPQRTLAAALAATATIPAAMAVLETVGGFEIPTAAYVAPTFFGGFSAAFAVVGSRVIYNLSRDVAAAKELGSYRLESTLGAGGMGEVWRASHRMLARPAAIKLIRQESLGSDPVDQRLALARFEREAQVTASLRSPHTVDLYDFGVSEEGTFYYVMELLEGFDAQVLVDRFGPLPPERVVHLLCQACESLGEAHAANLVHRDVKPSNLYVCRYGRSVDFVKVLDFGLVKPRQGGSNADAQLTAANVVSGTPGFMAPEQVLGQSEIDYRADIYAVGCVAFWLLTGQTVFTGSTPMDTMLKHARDAPPAPSSCTEIAIPAALDSVVLQCLAKDPSERPADADALVDALSRIEVNQAWTKARAQEWWARHTGS